MLQNESILALLERSEKRRTERRGFLKAAGAATAATAGLSLLAACGDNTPTPTPTPTATSTTLGDADVLNFALNLEYLEAQFYSYAAFGVPLSSTLTGGVGTVGTVVGGRQVNFTDPVVAQYAREIAQDEINHVTFLKSAGALGSSAVAMPSINIDGSASASAAFTALATAAKIIGTGSANPTATTFDPYASDENFLLAAFVFEDVGVTAYKGASPLIANKTYLEAAAGILAVEGYHAGLVRTLLYAKGMATPSLITNAGLISDARDSVDGASDDDQGIAMSNGASNIVPTDNTTGITYSRSTGQVLNVVYLNKAAVSSGGFFPSGMNGSIKTSAASG